MLLHWLSPYFPVLPQLCKLNWYFDGDTCDMPPMAAAGLMNGGNLRHFTLDLIGPPDPSFSMIIEDICPILTDIRSFSLSTALTHQTEVALPPVINDKSSIWRLSQLQSINISVRFIVTRQILVSLSRLPLQSLTLRQFSTSLTARPPGLPFPALRNLSLVAVASDIADMILSMSFPNATGLSLTMDIFSGRSSTPMQRTTIRAIYSKFPASLRRIRIKVKSTKYERDETVWLGPNAIKFDDFVLPLQSLPNLRELTLRVRLLYHVHGFLGLSNRDLESLASSWPELELFEYHIYSGYSTWPSLRPDHPTLDTIFGFARAHPRLLHLQLPSVLVDRLPRGLDGTSPQEDASPHLQGHGLLWFSVDWPLGGSSQGVLLEPTVLARAIDRAFPQVRKEIQRRHAINAQRSWSYLEKELFELHDEEDGRGM